MAKSKKNIFERFSDWATKFTGSPHAFLGATAIVVIWALSGPIFNYSETWQLVINTGTTIITFLMVFLIQKAQNKDSKAIQIKLNELIASHEKSSNRIVDIEDLNEEELDQLHTYYEKLSDLAKEDADIHTSHSIDAAERNHNYKHEFFMKKHEEWLQKQQKKESH
ncbi:low affinity iron permease family protein [Chryseobacterium daecheongense]|uniref:Low affinity Fe/Cu permease n=1 Tax=Chryseobacterium daecheongense TaxID=192389 RepID=A0A3N0VSB8_9FLAO|nr:low affinity iron permease family protein [Chryseobacterium daecheongense]ROH95709.1 low affinity iron permease family protein [Chryseobacterium daecheongense]TDX91906.1 low affinity Fe/Cu permease [Chryseobacterium daecheongense]